MLKIFNQNIGTCLEYAYSVGATREVNKTLHASGRKLADVSLLMSCIIPIKRHIYLKVTLKSNKWNASSGSCTFFIIVGLMVSC